MSPKGDPSEVVPLTPSLPQPVKCLGWKVHTYTPPDSISDGSVTNQFSALCILIQILSRADAKWAKKLNGFKFGTFIGHFPSDGVASMAVKGLNTLCNLQHFSAGWGDGEGEAAASKVFSVPQNPHAQLLFSHRQGQGYRWEKGLVVSACLLLQRPFCITRTEASSHLCSILCVYLFLPFTV